MEQRCNAHAGSARAYLRFHTPVWDEPHQRDTHEDGIGNPLVDEGQRDGRGVEQPRKLPFHVAAERPRQSRVGALLGDEQNLKNGLGYCRHQLHRAVGRGRQRREVVFAYPAGDKRHERQPEQQVLIRIAITPALNAFRRDFVIDE